MQKYFKELMRWRIDFFQDNNEKAGQLSLSYQVTLNIMSNKATMQFPFGGCSVT